MTTRDDLAYGAILDAQRHYTEAERLQGNSNRCQERDRIPTLLAANIAASLAVADELRALRRILGAGQ